MNKQVLPLALSGCLLMVAVLFAVFINSKIQGQIEESKVRAVVLAERLYCFMAEPGSEAWADSREYLMVHRPESLSCKFPTGKKEKGIG